MKSHTKSGVIRSIFNYKEPRFSHKAGDARRQFPVSLSSVGD